MIVEERILARSASMRKYLLEVSGLTFVPGWALPKSLFPWLLILMTPQDVLKAHRLADKKIFSHAFSDRYVYEVRRCNAG